MRVNFSNMPDYDLVQQLFRADAMSAKMIILDAPDSVCADAEHEVERLYEQVADIYGHDEEAIAAVRMSMPGIHILMKYIDKQKDKKDYRDQPAQWGVSP